MEGTPFLAYVYWLCTVINFSMKFMVLKMSLNFTKSDDSSCEMTENSWNIEKVGSEFSQAVLCLGRSSFGMF